MPLHATRTRCHIAAETRPSSKTPPAPPGYIRIVGLDDLIVDEYTRGVAKLAGFVYNRDRFDRWDETSREWIERIDLETAWPIDLPLLVLAALETPSLETIELVGRRAQFLAYEDRYALARERDARRVAAMKKAELVEVAKAELKGRGYGWCTKAELMQRLLDARHRFERWEHPRWERDHEERRLRSELHRALALLVVGIPATVRGVAALRSRADTYRIGADPVDRTRDEAVVRLRALEAA
jgi:hypothetical protein